jgi:monoamine oxidase
MSAFDCDVAVIGAGLSGLHAAGLLEHHGFSVRVLEANNRTGGRIHSMRQLGPNAEAGGTYIGAGYTRIMEIAGRFDIPLIDVTPILEFFREQVLVLGREIVTQAEWPEHPANPFDGDYRRTMPWNFHRLLTMRENPLEAPEDWLNPRHAKLDISMHDWMRSLGLSDEVIRFGYGINTTFGSDANDVSALLMLFRGAFSKAQRRHAPSNSLGYTVERGVHRLPDAMAAALAKEVELGQAVTGIESTASDVRLATATGRTIRARRAICTLPFSVLGDVAFEPALPPIQADAIASLGSQPITQVYIGVKAPFWEGDGYPPSMFTDSTAGMVAAVRSGIDPAEVTHLTAWVVGPHADALEGLDEKAAGHRVISAIEEIRPAARGMLELIGLQSWGGDPYARGAWAYFKPGQVTRFAAQMGAAHGRLHFSGEHLARANRGMEAALETAETAVDEVLAAER